MKRVYFAFVFTEDDGSYRCTFPDLPGVAAKGETFAALETAARAAVEAHVQAQVDAGQAVAEPSDFPDVAKRTWKEEQQVATIIPIDTYLKDAPIRINLTSTTEKIEEITDFAKKIGKTRSEFMVFASLEYIRRNS